jgi:hypothetical protein
MKKFFTKRFLFSLLGLGLATWLQDSGHLGDGTAWVYALAIIIAGHHSVDIIRAWRGNNAGPTA